MYLKLFLFKAVDYFRHFYGFLLDETVNFDPLCWIFTVISRAESPKPADLNNKLFDTAKSGALINVKSEFYAPIWKCEIRLRQVQKDRCHCYSFYTQFYRAAMPPTESNVYLASTAVLLQQVWIS